MPGLKRIRVGTRASDLAMAQTRLVVGKLSGKFRDVTFEIVPTATGGDRIADRALCDLPSAAPFADELEDALLEGRIDMAVHSMKDLASSCPEGLVLAKAWTREDPRDALIVNGEATSIETLPEGALVATGSVRRNMFLSMLRPDLKIVPIRGNVDTRLRKLFSPRDGERKLDAIILAAAGLKRLGLEKYIAQYIDAGKMLPAANQGQIAIEIREEDIELKNMADSFCDEDAEKAASAEREFMRELGVDCKCPVAALAKIENGKVVLDAAFASSAMEKPACVKAVGDTPAEAAFEAAKEIRKIKSGEVVLVGAGPGNPDFITVAGCKALAKADVVVYDKLVSPELLRYAPTTSKKIFVGKQCGYHSASQDEINSILAREAIINKCVVRLKGGDPYVFGRGGEEREYLEARGIKVSVIPGITSAVAGPGAAGIPVTHRGKAGGFAVITAHAAGGGADALDYDSLARFDGTLVFLMGFSEIAVIAKGLLNAGKSPSLPAAVICGATTRDERFVSGTLRDIAEKAAAADLRPPGILVAGETSSMCGKNRLPLAGRKIFVPVVAGGMADGAAKLFRSLGADVSSFEVGKIVANPGALPGKNGWHDFTWLAFTSAVAVRMFSAEDVKAAQKAKVKVAAIGPAAALAAGEAGFEVSFMPRGSTGEEFAAEFCGILSPGDSVFHPVSAAAKSPLSKIAEKCRYVPAAVYGNVPGERPSADFFADADTVVFTCPSSVERTPLRKGMNAVAVGETTRKAAVAAGWENVSVAAVPSPQGMAEALHLQISKPKKMEVK